MEQEKSSGFIKYLNYKDILIILGLWLLTVIFGLFTRQFDFKSIFVSNFMHYMFIISGRFIFLALLIFYLTSFYPINFREIGFNNNKIPAQLLLGLSLVFALFIIILLIINIPLSYVPNINFTPVYKIKNPEQLVNSLLPLIFLFIANLVLGFSEQLLLDKIVFELFNFIICNKFISFLLTGLFYSILLFTFTPSRILLNFLIATICLILYFKTDSILSSSIFMAGYYSIYIFYIFGWEFIKF